MKDNYPVLGLRLTNYLLERGFKCVDVSEGYIDNRLAFYFRKSKELDEAIQKYIDNKRSA